MIAKRLPQILIGLAVVCATVSGYFVAVSFGAGSQTPQITTTVDVGGQGPTGPAGPIGPAGPAGSPGAESCPAGSTFGKLVLNGPKGQVSILTCIVN